MACGALALLASASAAATLRGVLRDSAGSPVANADFDVFDLEGRKLPDEGNSDPDGSYDLTLEPGAYDVVCQPPLSSGLAAQARRALRVSEERTLDWILSPAVRVVGRVTSPSGTGVAAARLEYHRADDGTRQPVEGDVTSAFGTFASYLEAGEYRVSVIPSEASGLAPARIGPRRLSAGDTLNLALVRASVLDAFVVGPGGEPVAGAKLVFERAEDGARQPAVGALTGTDGRCRAGVAPGWYRLVVEPPAGSGLAARRLEALDLGSNAALEVPLEAGVRLRGRVIDSNGLPLAGADWDAADESDDRSVPTPGDNTAADGSYELVLPPGTYRLTLTPPAGSALDPRVFRNVSVYSEVVLDVSFADTPGTRFTIAPLGNPVHTRALFRLALPEAGQVRVEIFDAAGRLVRELFDGWLPAGTHALPWDGRHGAGKAHTGVYYARASRGADRAVGRLVLLP